jgi:hypothetical protein
MHHPVERTGMLGDVPARVYVSKIGDFDGGTEVSERLQSVLLTVDGMHLAAL